MSRYVPDSGDLVWLNFTPQAGHEQKGHRPALCVSPKAYNKLTGLALFCPITSKAKGYPFEEPVHGGTIAGVVLCDHIKSLDFNARKVSYEARIPQLALDDICEKIKLLIG
jgi:mRNA interferase MazF